MQERLYGKSREKSYTLTIICDPELAGIEKNYKDYKRWLLEQRGAQGLLKPRRLVLNSAHDEIAGKSRRNQGPLLLDHNEEERFRRQHELVGKVVFLKDSDMEHNSFEREASKWVSMFFYKMHAMCSRKPRFSEMRPSRYNI